MRQGLDFQTLAAKVKATSKTADDFVVSGNNLRMTSDGKDIFHRIPDIHPYSTLTEVAHDQLAGRLGIPRAYYKKMREENTQLLADNVNAWFDGSGKHLLRQINNFDHDEIAHGNFTRAILSDRYRRIDNDVVIEELMPKVAEKDFEVQSCDITPYNMFIKISFPFAQAEVAKGDVVEAGVMLRNSEVGWGSCSVVLFVHRLVCTNGMVLPENIYQARKYHSGPKLVVDNDSCEIISDKTRMLEDKAMLSSLRDVIDTARDPKTIKRIADGFVAASEDIIEGEVTEVVERLSKRFLITSEEQDSVLEHLIRDGDLSRWGFANAVTRTAQDSASYDRATELEKIGGGVIEMETRDFMRLAA